MQVAHRILTGLLIATAHWRSTLRNATIVTGLAALLAACATATRVPLPNGHQGYAIETCRSVSECYKLAAKTCGGPYDVVNQSGETITTVSGAAGTVTSSSVPQYAMVIECKSAGSEPGDKR
jgi:hypothetical protein